MHLPDQQMCLSHKISSFFSKNHSLTKVGIFSSCEARGKNIQTARTQQREFEIKYVDKGMK